MDENRVNNNLSGWSMRKFLIVEELEMFFDCILNWRWLKSSVFGKRRVDFVCWFFVLDIYCVRLEFIVLGGVGDCGFFLYDLVFWIWVVGDGLFVVFFYWLIVGIWCWC